MLDKIKKDLHDRLLIDPAVLQEYLAYLEDAFMHTDLHIEEIAELLYDCQMRLINWKIDHMTDSARSLLSQKKASLAEAVKLQNQIASFCTDHTLSLENRSMLLIARLLLQQIVPEKKHLELPQNDEKGQMALEIAYALHLDNLPHARTLASHLPTQAHAWVSRAGGDLLRSLHPEDLLHHQNLKQKTIAGLIGYAQGELPTDRALRLFFSEINSLQMGI